MINEKYIKKLGEAMGKENLDAVYVAPSEDLEFLMGFSPHMDERFQGLFVTKDKQLFYVVPKLNKEEIQRTLEDHGAIYDWDDGEGFLSVVKLAFEDFELMSKSIGVNGAAKAGNIIDIKNALGVEFKNGKATLEEIRIIKGPEEIERLKTAAKMADRVFEEIIHYIKPGMQEKDICNKIIEIFEKLGADGVSFHPIIASGTNSSMPHYNKYSRYIEEKDIIILDFGCKYKGLCSDMSRTVFVGDISPEERKIYEIISKANEEGEKAAKEGMKASHIDKISRDIIKNAGYGEYFLNRLGHGIGYGVHEAPEIKGGNDRILEKGMAFSIEPGIYLPGKFGIRIEDILLIGDHGTEILNKATKEIIVVQ